MKKIAVSIKALPINAIICVITVVLYFSNNFFFKEHTSGWIHQFLICHFNDFLGGILFTAYTNIIIYTKKRLLHKLWQIVCYCFVAGLFWEFVTPLFRKDSVSDWIDVASYVLGGIVYWLILKINEKWKKGRKDNID